MNKIISAAALASFCAASTGVAQATDVTFALGRTGDSTTVYRIGTQVDFGSRWLQSSTGHLGGYWDAGYTYWEGDETAANHSLSLSPVFVYEFTGQRFRPYIEAGVGVAAFTSTEVEDNDLGSSFQFEDRLGVGVRFADQEFGVRVIHYSNGGLKQPNDGVETYTVHYRVRF